MYSLIQDAIFVNYGTYTTKGGNLTITLPAEFGGQPETYLFSVKGTSLTLSSPFGGMLDGLYTKQ
jgi:hypothetical protein